MLLILIIIIIIIIIILIIISLVMCVKSQSSIKKIKIMYCTDKYRNMQRGNIFTFLNLLLLYRKQTHLPECYFKLIAFPRKSTYKWILTPVFTLD